MIPLNKQKRQIGKTLDMFQQEEIEKIVSGLMALPGPIRRRITRSWYQRVGGSLLIGFLLATFMLSLTWIVFRRYKSKQRNMRDESRFDFIDDVSQTMNTNVDFDHASLDELEEALLKVENQLEKHLQSDGKV